ncbi:BrnT family toxin [Chlorobium sp. KB01]|uniref:BrnT family toxin n=1 Tax=Chlorobium sp. KB01 TaxID=1917528 RepID=UPI0009754E4C
MAIEFQWDNNKARSNSEKHGVTFQEAKTVFYDEFADQYFDQKNSDEEDRFLLLGRSIHSRILMVCHCYRESDNVIRIISARKATKSETKFYRGN